MRIHKDTAICVGLLGLLSAGGVSLVLVRFLQTGTLHHTYLIWNLFLAWIPLIAAVFMDWMECGGIKARNWNIAKFTSLGALWLAFYPNAPYMITDFIHLSRKGWLLFWYDFILLALFSIVGLIAGFLSLFLVHRRISGGFKMKSKGWSFVLAVNYLSGFAIYLGRVKRSNSWDIVNNPIVLLNDVLDSLHYAPLAFSILFGTFLCLVYVAMYSISNLKNGRELVEK